MAQTGGLNISHAGALLGLRPDQVKSLAIMNQPMILAAVSHVDKREGFYSNKKLADLIKKHIHQGGKAPSEETYADFVEAGYLAEEDVEEIQSYLR